MKRYNVNIIVVDFQSFIGVRTGALPSLVDLCVAASRPTRRTVLAWLQRLSTPNLQGWPLIYPVSG